MGSAQTYYCWWCYARTRQPAAPCVVCGQPVQAPADASYEERLIWALGHPLPGTQMMAAQILGERREATAEEPLRALVLGADPFLAAQALQSLVSIVGVERLEDLLHELARSGAPAVSRVAERALAGIR